MIELLIVIGLSLVAIIHVPPIVGVLGRPRLEALYQTPIESPDLLVLMRHRAVLFAMFAGATIYAIFHPPVRPLALGMGWLSVGAYLALARGTANPALRRVFIADVIAVGGLITATVGVCLQ